MPNTTHHFFCYFDASLIGLATILFQPNTENKMQGITYNSRILVTQKQRLSSYDRELYSLTFALS